MQDQESWSEIQWEVLDLKRRESGDLRVSEVQVLTS